MLTFDDWDRISVLSAQVRDAIEGELDFIVELIEPKVSEEIIKILRVGLEMAEDER